MQNIIDEHDPIKIRIVKCESVPYIYLALQKARYQQNMKKQV